MSMIRYISTLFTYIYSIYLSTIYAGRGQARGEAVLTVLPRGAAGDQHRGGGRQAEVRLQHLHRLRDRGHEQEQGPGGDQHPQQPMIH